MLYYFVKYTSKIGFRVNFKKVFFHSQEELPDNTAIIIAVLYQKTIDLVEDILNTLFTFQSTVNQFLFESVIIT